jgi:hypothetical protein
MLCQWHHIHGKYDTACTIDKRFERPWQPLKGISIKNIYVPELSYTSSLKKYINLKGIPKKTFSCMRCHWHRKHACFFWKSIISRRIRSRIQKGFRLWSWAQGVLFDGKTEGWKSRDTVPLTTTCWQSKTIKTLEYPWNVPYTWVNGF